MRKLVIAFLLPLLFSQFMYATESTGISSWYGESHRGKLQANGRPFNPDAMTAASWHYKLGTEVRVTSAESGKSVLVKITDRGPNKRLKGRILDLSAAAFAKLAPPSRGLIPVSIEKVIP